MLYCVWKSELSVGYVSFFTYVSFFRFERDKKLKQKLAEENSNLEDEKLQEQAKLEGPKNCITVGCNMYGTVLTSYLCTSCYEKQRHQVGFRFGLNGFSVVHT